MRLLLLSFLLLLPACATVSPQACTDTWFDREAREAFRPIRQDLRPTLDRLRKTSASIEEGGVLSAVRMALALENVLRLVETFEERTLPRLNRAAQQCDDPAFVRRALFDFLDQEGIEDLDLLLNAFESRLVPHT